MEGLDFNGKTVLDVGSGLGGRSLGWLDLGAVKVVNVDINRQELEVGKAILTEHYHDRANQIDFWHPNEMAGLPPADMAVLFDCFEHLIDPQGVLEQVYRWLRPGGLLWIGSIGWYNYMASHCMGTIPIPWSQVVFSEKAIIKTIRRVLHSANYQPNVWERMEGLDRWDYITTLRDRPGEPLNMLSLRKIRKVLRQSPFKTLKFSVFGFSGNKRGLARLASPLARLPILNELFHSYYTALLVKPEEVR